ncbi:4Fe-4S cluster-binding domain-containing protein [Methanobrevibacter sp. DSM 116169]|uniref:4Fe-4S cluster-binding domain-containing protein n=1 Tax=Methanobrevibacter sp. DSM 116169 TaxID=3242727 RepID=UPI0038FCA8AA
MNFNYYDNLYINEDAKKLAKVNNSGGEFIDNVYMWHVSKIDDPPYTSLAIFFNFCTLDCPTCCNRLLLSGSGGSTPFYLGDIDKYKDKVDSVTVVGGEPFAQDLTNIGNILQRAKDLGLRTNALTNGLHLWEDDVRKLWPYIDHINLHVTEEFMALGLYEKVDELPFDVDYNVIWHPNNMPFVLDCMGLLEDEKFHIKKDFMYGGQKFIPTKI